jgi:hypothetical protein
MIKLKDLLANSSQKGHVSNHHPAHAFAPIKEADEDSVADADMKSAKRLKKPLTKAIADIARSIDNINKTMSDFNAPGLRVAFLTAIKKGIDTARYSSFDERAAYKRFEDYYKR